MEDQFRKLFGRHPLVKASSPGRINLIGEHTDYNSGFVLPAPIKSLTTVLLAPNRSREVRAFAQNGERHFNFELGDNSPHKGWESYILGVTELLNAKRQLAGFDLLIYGDVPIGAGLSSSASLTCALAKGLNELFNLDLELPDLAYIAQAAEHHFVGVKCGIMDQFASLMGKPGQAILLDCQSMDYRYVPLDLGDYTLLLCNTNVSHSLADSEYNLRRQQCEQGLDILRKHYPKLTSLRDVSLEMLKTHRDEFPEKILRRCRFVLEENGRVLAAVKTLQDGDIETFGKLLNASHQGLSKDYEVSCVELDFLAQKAQESPFVAGARMMGGGFGGCTLNVILKNEINGFLNQIKPLYKEQFSKEMMAILIE